MGIDLDLDVQDPNAGWKTHGMGKLMRHGKTYGIYPDTMALVPGTTSMQIYMYHGVHEWKKSYSIIKTVLLHISYQQSTPASTGTGYSSTSEVHVCNAAVTVYYLLVTFVNSNQGIANTCTGTIKVLLLEY